MVKITIHVLRRCVVYDSKEFTSNPHVLLLTQTQQGDIQIFAIYHSFHKDIMATTITQCIEHITLDVYSKAQKSLPQNSRYL